jgi:hypothetical protein
VLPLWLTYDDGAPSNARARTVLANKLSAAFTQSILGVLDTIIYLHLVDMHLGGLLSLWLTLDDGAPPNTRARTVMTSKLSSDDTQSCLYCSVVLVEASRP